MYYSSILALQGFFLRHVIEINVMTWENWRRCVIIFCCTGSLNLLCQFCVSASHVILQGKGVLASCVFAVTREMITVEQERTQSSTAVDSYINPSLAEELQNYSFHFYSFRMQTLTTKISETQQMKLHRQKMKALVFCKGLSRK